MKKKISNFLKNEKIEESPENCSLETVQKFIYETANVLSPHTQARRLSGLRSFFDYLIFERDRHFVPGSGSTGYCPHDIGQCLHEGKCSSERPRTLERKTYYFFQMEYCQAVK